MHRRVRCSTTCGSDTTGCCGPGSDALRRCERAGAALTELLGIEPALERPVEELSISDRQACCIVRALVRDPKVLILDEATSALDVATRDRLFAILRRLAASGVAVVFISHRMDEISEIADRITVLRSGDSVATVQREATSPRELVSLMTGRDHLVDDEARERAARVAGAAVLRASQVRVRPDAAPFDFTLHAGEIVGVAGLEGHGQDAFLHLLRGAPSAGGALFSLDGAGTRARSIRRARRGGTGSPMSRVSAAPRRCSRHNRFARTSRCRR